MLPGREDLAMERRHKFLVVPSAGELGPGPYDGKPVEYEIAYQPPTPTGGVPPDPVRRLEVEPFGEPIDVLVDVAPYEPIETRVRFTWATSDRLREFRDCYRSW